MSILSGFIAQIYFYFLNEFANVYHSLACEQNLFLFCFTYTIAIATENSILSTTATKASERCFSITTSTYYISFIILFILYGRQTQYLLTISSNTHLKYFMWKLHFIVIVSFRWYMNLMLKKSWRYFHALYYIINLYSSESNFFCILTSCDNS